MYPFNLDVGGNGSFLKGLVMLVALGLGACGTVQQRGLLALGTRPGASTQVLLSVPAVRPREGCCQPPPSLEALWARSDEEEEAARQAEVKRALAHVRILTDGVVREGTRLCLAYWVENGAVTLVDYQALRSEGTGTGLATTRGKMEQEVGLALTGYGGGAPRRTELVLKREGGRWTVESVSRVSVTRPPEARQVAVKQEGVSAENYIQAYDLAARLLKLLRAPEAGEAIAEVEVSLEDGRVVGAEPRYYGSVHEGGGLRGAGPELTGEVAWLLLAFAEGLGPRTLQLRVRAAHLRGESQARGWVESARLVETKPWQGEDEEFAAAYRRTHEETLRLWREGVWDGAKWVMVAGVEQFAMWYAGGLITRGVGVLAELTLPVIRTVLGRGGAVTARWLRSALVRLPPEARQDFARLWAKVALEGEAALAASERETLRRAMVQLERVVKEPLEKGAKTKLRDAARVYYEELRPELRHLLQKGSDYQIHHRRGLEYAQLFPDEDVNAMENLALVYKKVHEGLNRVWGKFRKARPDATAEEVRNAAREIDECFKQWYDKPVDARWEPLLADAEKQALQRLSNLFPGMN